VEKAYNNPAFGMMGTGGSSSIKGFYLPARKLGAQARAVLVAAAAQQLAVPAGELRTKAGSVYHDASQRSVYLWKAGRPRGHAAGSGRSAAQDARPVHADRQAGQTARHPRQGHGARRLRHRY
jgi:CO/xanthine dehydrogenase Mo-binding subunit